MEETIRKAEQKDIKRLESFLLEANVNAEGVADSIDYYSLLETKSGTLKACIGIEPVNGVGMLRSFVLSEGTTQVQILLLFDRVIKIAESKKEKALFRTQRKPVEAGAHGTLSYTIKKGINKNKIADEKILKSKN